MPDNPLLAIKIDVDTERGTRLGVPNLLEVLKEVDIPATFLFSLGPDNTGRAIKRIFRPGFLKKIGRTNVIGTYGLRTLLNGVLWPGPMIAKRHANIMRQVRDAGHEVGIHSFDHCYWQDKVHTISREAVFSEFRRACDEFENVFKKKALCSGAPGWQTNANALAAYDSAKFTYASDCRGTFPFIPRIADTVFETPQLPTTLPTLDELLGRPEFPESSLNEYYFSIISHKHPNIFTIHAEIEGMPKRDWFRSFCLMAKKRGVSFKTMAKIAEEITTLPICEVTQGEVDGRSGLVAMQRV